MTGVSQDPAYYRLKEHLIAKTGLAFYANRDSKLVELIDQRLSDLGLRDYSSYTEFLADGAGGKAEMELLTGQLTIGETYFFRDLEQFAAIRDVILPDILERKRSSGVLRIWSAGCATGAEPYSLAILLMREFSSRIAGWQVDIQATDLNRSYLTQAAEGKFREHALNSTSDEVKRECFSKEGLLWTIHPRYKQWISFHYMNLVESQFSAPLAAGTHFDLILCRNVMIYFTPKVNRHLAGQFHKSLGDEGWLVVGASEHNPENYQEFRTVNAAGATLYQKAPLLIDSRKTKCGAISSLSGSEVRAAPFALPSNSRKTECGAISSLSGSEVRAAPFALPSNSRKTECGAISSLSGSEVRAAPFALPSNSRKTECGAISSLSGSEVPAAPFALLRNSPAERGLERRITASSSKVRGAIFTPRAKPLAQGPGGPSSADVEGLLQLADRGDWQGAVEYGQRLLTRDRLNPTIHFYQALIFENLGIAVESERSLRQAIYLDRNFALAHYHLGLALKRDRQMLAAARSFGNVLRVLAAEPEDKIVAAGPGVTVTGLRELARMHLEKSGRS